MKKYKKHIRLFKNLEKKLSIRNKKKLKKVFIDFSEKIKKDNGSKFADEVKVVIDIDYKYLQKKFKDVLEVIYLYNLDETIGVFKNAYNKKLSEKVIKGVRDYFVEDFNKKNALKKAKMMTNTTKDKLNKIIVQAQREGWSHKDLVKEIMSSVENMSEYRTSTIARTETSSSINQVSFKTSKASGMKEKGWVHIGGKEMDRENHKVLNNKWIKINEKWDLGSGIYAECPHDPDLPASETVRCSCLQIYR